MAIGGALALERLVDRFYHYMDTEAEAAKIRAMHAADLSLVKGVLLRYLIEWTGGPALYSVERGHPRLRRRHQPFAIGEAERDAWMLCMRKALADVVADVVLRSQLEEAFFKVADFMRNDANHIHPGSYGQMTPKGE